MAHSYHDDGYSYCYSNKDHPVSFQILVYFSDTSLYSAILLCQIYMDIQENLTLKFKIIHRDNDVTIALTQ